MITRKSGYIALLVLLSAAPAWAADRVLVAPFSTLNVPEGQKWIGRGVQENLVAGRPAPAGGDSYSTIAFQGQVIVEDNATAARLARASNASLAIRGAAQMVGREVRVTAQLIDAATGDTLRAASVTGSPDDLLALEDQLAAQLRGTPAATTASSPATASAPAAPAAPAASEPAAPEPQIVLVQQPVEYPTYHYVPYAPTCGYYPSYSYSSPYAYPPGYYSGTYTFIVTTGGGGHDRDCNWRPVSPVITVTHSTPRDTFNPAGMPIPVNNVLPIPTNNVLPVPTGRVIPVSSGSSLPAARPAPAVRSNAPAKLPQTVPVSLSRNTSDTARPSAGRPR